MKCSLFRNHLVDVYFTVNMFPYVQCTVSAPLTTHDVTCYSYNRWAEEPNEEVISILYFQKSNKTLLIHTRYIYGKNHDVQTLVSNTLLSLYPDLCNDSP